MRPFDGLNLGHSISFCFLKVRTIKDVSTGEIHTGRAKMKITLIGNAHSCTCGIHVKKLFILYEEPYPSNLQL